jgi:hypothetical protein
VDLDGAEVKRLGAQIVWRAFVDPYPKEKRKRRDVYAHAKIAVLRHGDSETTVFGSCNASEPALMGPNTETAIILTCRVSSDHSLLENGAGRLVD